MARQYAAIPVRYDRGREQMPLREPDHPAETYRQLQELCQSVEAAGREGLEAIAAASSGDDDRFENKPYHEKGGHRERSQANDRRRGSSHREHWKKEERRGR